MKKEGATSDISAYLRGGYKDESGEPLTPSQTPSMYYYMQSRLRCQPIFRNKVKLKVHFQSGVNMKRTVDEKVKYNEQQKTPFSWGYRWGVRAYRKYPKADNAERKRILAEIDGYKNEAVNGKGKSRECAKGFMCGVRDAANERKARQ